MFLSRERSRLSEKVALENPGTKIVLESMASEFEI